MMSKRRKRRRRMGRERKKRSHRISDKIQRARSASSLLLPLPLFSLLLFFSVTPLDCRAPLLPHFSRSFVRTRSFTSPARRCTFFSNPLLRYSAALNGRLLLPPAERRKSASGRRSSSVFFRFYYKTFRRRGYQVVGKLIEALCQVKQRVVINDLDID